MKIILGLIAACWIIVGTMFLIGKMKPAYTVMPHEVAMNCDEVSKAHDQAVADATLNRIAKFMVQQQTLHISNGGRTYTFEQTKNMEDSQ